MKSNYKDKRDLCILKLGEQKQDIKICEEVSQISRKDSCYMKIALDNKDYPVCSKIINKHLKQSCESLK